MTPIMVSIIVPGREKKIDISKYIGSGKVTDKTALDFKTITYEVEITPPLDQVNYI